MEEISMKQDKNTIDAVKCREIVKEILDFGVSQYQVMTIIKFLAMELEDRNFMISIRKIVEEEIKKTENENSIII